MIGLFVFTAGLQLVNNAFSRIVVPTAMTVFYSPHTAATHATLLSAGALSVAAGTATLVGVWADALRDEGRAEGPGTPVDRHSHHHGGQATAALPQTRLTLLGAAMMVAALCAMGVAFPSEPELWMAAFALMTVGATLCGTAYEAVKADLVPPDKRGTGGALQGVYETVGSSAGYLLATYALPIAWGGEDHTGRAAARSGSFFFVCAGIVATLAAVSSVAAVRVRLPHTSVWGAVWFCVPSMPCCGRRGAAAPAAGTATGDDYHEPLLADADDNGSVQRDHLDPPLAPPAVGWCARWGRLFQALRDRDLMMLAVSRVAYAAGLAVTQLHFFYLKDVVGARDSSEASKWLTWSSFVDSGTVVVATVVAGALSDTQGRKRFVYASTALYITAFVALPWVPRRGIALFLAGPSVLFGLAHGVQKAVDFAILVDVIDREPLSVGTYVGVWATAGTLGSAAGSYMFGPLLDAFPDTSTVGGHSRTGFVVTYSVVASAAMLFSAVAVWAIRDRRLRSPAHGSAPTAAAPPVDDYDKAGRGACQRFAVTGGFFDGTADGFIAVLEVWTAAVRTAGGCLSMRVTHLRLLPPQIVKPPDPALAVPNKGLAGASWHDGALWTCFPNQVVAYLPPLAPSGRWRRHAVINNNRFNDLHHVSASAFGIVVANTGHESVDALGFDGSLLAREPLVGGELQQQRVAEASSAGVDYRVHSTKSKTPHQVHVNHVACLGPAGEGVENQLDVLVTTFGNPEAPSGGALTAMQLHTGDSEGAGEVPGARQSRLVARFDSFPHDGAVDPRGSGLGAGKPAAWVTLVTGEVAAIDIESGERLKTLVVHARNGCGKGWTRGLHVLPEGTCSVLPPTAPLL